MNNNFAEILPANADLGIVKTANAASVPVGATITYTLTVTNYGISAAQGVQVLDTLPPDAIYQSANGTGWTISQTGGTITATLPSLAVNASSQITVMVKAPAVADTLTNTATVSSTTPDSNPIEQHQYRHDDGHQPTGHHFPAGHHASSQWLRALAGAGQNPVVWRRYDGLHQSGFAESDDVCQWSV